MKLSTCTRRRRTSLALSKKLSVLREPFVIAKAGKPMVTVTAHQPEKLAKRKLGTLNGQFLIPGDFDTMYEDEIIRLFEGEDEGEPRVGNVLQDLLKAKE